MTPIRLRNRDIERFWGQVNRTSTCWIWRGIISDAGYGKFRVLMDGVWKTVFAHRVCWTLTEGSIPPGFDCLHKCTALNCVNPAHLFLAESVREMQKAGKL